MTIIKLVQIYISRDEERKVQAAKKAALFKYRTQTSTFKSDEVEEIDADLKKNFPEHLKDLEQRLGNAVCSWKSLLFVNAFFPFFSQPPMGKPRTKSYKMMTATMSKSKSE